MVVPVALGTGVGFAWGDATNTAIFLGSALAATSVGITARVFSDLGALTRIESRAVLGAAVADDVLGLILLTIVVRVVSKGTVNVFDVLSIIAIAVAFLVVSVAIGTRFGPRVFGFVDQNRALHGNLCRARARVHPRIRARSPMPQNSPRSSVRSPPAWP